MGCDVVFNYIIKSDDIKRIKDYFKNYEINFKVLLTDEEELLKRDKLRDEDCRMNERCLTLLRELKKEFLNTPYIINSTNLSIDETVKRVKNGG